MRRSTFIALILTLSGFLFGTGIRSATLGNFTPMLRGDVQNLYFFPQVLSQHNLMYVEGVGMTNNTSFMFTVGEPDSRWGIASGDQYEHNFITAVHALDENRAVGFEFRFKTWKHEETNDMATPADGSNKYVDFALNGVYGWNNGTDEMAIYGGFSHGPGDIMYHGISWMGNGWSPNGTFNYNDPGGYYGGEGTASDNEFALGARLRRPHELNFFGIPFTYFYANVLVDWWGSKSDFSSQGSDDSLTSVEDEKDSNLFFNGEAHVFNQVAVADGAILYYALGADVGLSSGTFTDNTNEWEDKSTTFYLGGPNCNVGVETSHKFGHFRFGCQSGIDFLLYDKMTATDTASDNADETKEFSIGQNGYYNFSTGWGGSYGNLHVDITLNQAFWTAGPQMIFDSGWGSLGGVADIYFLFNK